MSVFTIKTVCQDNVETFGLFCIKNKKHPGHIAKRLWLDQAFAQGLKIRLLLNEHKKPAGFIETMPGETTWRTLNAPGYDVIQCLWTDHKKYQVRGMASMLINACVEEAAAANRNGVAVVTSDGSWMASRKVFLKNRFELVAETLPAYQIMVRKLRLAESPAFPDNWSERLKVFQRLTLIYTHQCPYIGKVIKELPEVAERFNVKLELREINDPAESRQVFPSPYGVFCLLYRGKILADHPISATRFRNILQKELNLIAKS